MAFTGEIGHLTDIESPLSNAGGVAKTTEEVELLSRTGVGTIEDGSHCREKRYGNDAEVNPETGEVKKGVRKVWHYDPETGIMANSLGMPGEGMDAVIPEVPERVRISHSRNKKYILNVAPVSHDPVSESIELVKRGYDAGADAVLLNAGCPNVVTEDGGRHEILSRSPVEFGKVLMALADADLPKPIFVRLSPQENYAAMNTICRYIQLSGIVSAVYTPNTWPGYRPLDKDGEPILEVPGGTGGKSGPATADDALREAAWAVQSLRGSGIDVVRSGGIMNAREVKTSLDLGVKACAGTTFFYVSENGWPEDVGRLLTDLAQL